MGWERSRSIEELKIPFGEGDIEEADEV